ncbi:hypothetical protein QR680_009250 [Steinernema hermaphroditum]|uniref:C2H2-type domain-containing protein n=1 Tax=Steinernema hermaphroditum TaxID=289476 RepID=A0AA39IKW4_9BILA|nr:hypothetical protein QR680_009250 [Steinernema hermaphroditum]
MAYYSTTYDSSGFLFDPSGVSPADPYFPAGPAGYPTALEEHPGAGLHYGAWVHSTVSVVDTPHHFAEDFGPWPPNPAPPPVAHVPSFPSTNSVGAFSVVQNHVTSNPPPTARNESTRLFSCPTCHKQYCRKSTLKAHMRQHMGQRPFTCQICGKCFSQAANLTAHKRVHTGEKPFECPICLRPFSQSSSLVTHKRTHTGERPYPCPHCDKAFTDSSTLTKHLRTHTGQKPYGCHLCMMRFTQSGNLHRHMKTHRPEVNGLGAALHGHI